VIAAVDVVSAATAPLKFGINYGQIANNLPHPTQVSGLLRSLNVNRVKLYDADPAVLTAFAGTGVIFLGMATLSSVIKRDLSAMGKWLFIGAVMLLVAGIANFFIQSSALMVTLSVVAIGIFSAFILHDLKRVQDGHETNYITATLGVYLSIYNVFQSLLMLLGIVGGDD
jgi:FtsH-binding integral membrane protein